MSGVVHAEKSSLEFQIVIPGLLQSHSYTSVMQNQLAGLLTSILFLGTFSWHHSHSRGFDGQEVKWSSNSLLVSSTPQLGQVTVA